MDLSDDQDVANVAPHNRLKDKGDSPWTSPSAKEADATVFHADATHNTRPKVRHFVDTINLGFTVTGTKRGTLNIDLLLKRFMYFAKQADPKFHREPLNGSRQCITNPSKIPTSKEGVEL
jgi:hypothetical protein